MRVANALVVDEIRDRPDDGSVDLIGLREDLYFDDVPVVLEQLTLFIELEIGPNDRGTSHKIDIKISGPDGELISAAPIKFSLPADFPRPFAPLDPTLFDTTFKAFGPHALDIFVGGVHSRRLFLTVLPREAGDGEAAGETA